mmetsp:Transcript_34038/g.62602  ORF Transcript_34038/g.62602 Transcript_34038/m.62602 type:complete len:562 (+) Transcript_34038:132-1817(+)
MNPRRKSQRRNGHGISLQPSSSSRCRLRSVSHLVAAISLALLDNKASLLHSAQAYVTSGLPAHTHRAFLRQLTDDICATDPGTLMPQECQNASMLMSAWASAPSKLNLSSGVNGKARAVAVEGLLKRMIDERRAGNVGAIARTEDYNAVMKSWAMSGERRAAAIRVEQILMNMQEMYASGDKDVQPNLESFEIAIEAWSKATDEPNALSRAQQILDWMTKLYLSSSNDLAQPHTSCFYPILKSWAVSGKMEAPIMAEHLIMWMQHLQMKEGIETAQPDTVCLNIVLSCWLKSKDITAEKRIRQVFEYMDKCARMGCIEFKPDASTYNIVISSIAPAVKKYYDMGGARRADRILARLEKGFLAGDELMRPDTIIYNQVIDYWAKTQSFRCHYLRAREVLDRQITMHESGVRKCRPDTTSYTSVIAACASTYGSKMEKRRSFDLAHATFMEACKEKHTHPNEITYGLMFKAVGRLLPKEQERDRYAKTLFGLCCDDGRLGEMAYNRMKEAVTKKTLVELTGGKSHGNFPAEWKLNVKTPMRKRFQNKEFSKGKEIGKKNELRP